MGIIRNIVIGGFLFFLITACSGNELEYEDYLKYINDQENGLMKEKEVSGLQYKVKYLPVDYLVYNDLNKIEGKQNLKEEKKKLEKQYAHSLCFMMTMGPADDENFDLTYLGVKNYDEYAKQMEVLNFKMGTFLTLEMGGKLIKPELVQMENTYGLGKQRNFMILFSVKDNKKDKFMKDHDVRLIYSDELFGTGINNFSFQKEVIKNLPELIKN